MTTRRCGCTLVSDRAFEYSHKSSIFINSSIMPKRPQADSHSEAINFVFETLFTINVSKPEAVRVLKKLKLQFFSAEAEKKNLKLVHKATKKFTFIEAVQDFGLTYNESMTDAEKYWWKIETLPEAKTFQPLPCLGKVSS